jgi:septum formation protein
MDWITKEINRINRPKAELILASGSPRRQELLKLCGIPFTVVTADIDEVALELEVRMRHHEATHIRMAKHIVRGLAKKKAEIVFASHPEAVILSADTVVLCGNEIMGKPTSEEDAYRMLHKLSGRTHQVLTGVCIMNDTDKTIFHTATKVTFHPWKDGGEELAKKYIATGSPMDKAGAYGIQDLGALFVKEIKGDYYTVMGFPIAEVHRRLMNFFPMSERGGAPNEPA